MNPNPFGNLIHPSILISGVLSFLGMLLFAGGMVLIEMGLYQRGIGVPLSIAMAFCGVVGLICGIVGFRKVTGGNYRRGGTSAAVWGIGFSFLSLVGFGISTQFPLIALKRANGQREICSQNLLSLHSALMIYASRNGGRFPEEGQWCSAVLATTDELNKSDEWSGSLFQCPGALKINRCSYAFNTFLSGARTNDVASDAVLLFEVDGGWNFAGDPGVVGRERRHMGNLHVTVGGEVVAEP